MNYSEYRKEKFRYDEGDTVYYLPPIGSPLKFNIGNIPSNGITSNMEPYLLSGSSNKIYSGTHTGINYLADRPEQFVFYDEKELNCRRRFRFKEGDTVYYLPPVWAPQKVVIEKLDCNFEIFECRLFPYCVRMADGTLCLADENYLSKNPEHIGKYNHNIIPEYRTPEKELTDDEFRSILIDCGYERSLGDLKLTRNYFPLEGGSKEKEFTWYIGNGYYFSVNENKESLIYNQNIRELLHKAAESSNNALRNEAIRIIEHIKEN